MDKNEEKIALLKRIHGLEGKDVEWCIIDEGDDEYLYKLGLSVVGTRLYLDIEDRRFRSVIDLPEIQRRVYPAVEVPTADKDTIYFEAKDNPEMGVAMLSSFIEDIYSDMIYRPGMENKLIL